MGTVCFFLFLDERRAREGKIMSSLERQFTRRSSGQFFVNKSSIISQERSNRDSQSHLLNVELSLWSRNRNNSLGYIKSRSCWITRSYGSIFRSYYSHSQFFTYCAVSLRGWNFDLFS